MNILYIVIILVVLFLIINNHIILKKIGINKKIISDVENIGDFFELKNHFFTYTEKLFFNELQKQNNEQYIILSKVRLEDIVSAKKSLDWKEKGIKRNYIKSKHIDFVILNKQISQILCVIELDGKSHDQEKQSKYDKIKNDILNTIGVKFYRIQVGSIFTQKIKTIFESLNTL